MARAVLLSHESSLEHDTGMHPERAERLVAFFAELDSRSIPLDRSVSPAASLDLLRLVHPDAYIASIRRFIEAGGGPIDLDTVVSPGSWVAALHSAGGACAAVDLMLDGTYAFAASAHRPPGHHAEAAEAMGFCLFNNVAVAAAHARAAHGIERVLVLDWDVHHGNGTNAIFHASPDVLFASIHEWPLYPGSGAASDVGSGEGVGYSVNLPVPAGWGDEVFVSLVAHVVVPLARSFAPGLVLISAGFDAHADDPLAGCLVTDGGYAAMAASMRALGAELGVPVGLVLEGGYDLGALSRSLCDVLETFAADETPAPPDLPVHPLAAEAQLRLAEHWPAVAPA